jgi:transcription initiation factor TFIIH subunit 1
MTIAQTVSKPEEDEYNDAKLLADVELQRSLLSTNEALLHRFNQAVRDRPDTITLGQLSNQFWTTRVHLLRSHAVEKAQGAGTYNVLSVVKPVNDGGQFKLNMSKEQIQLIFAQHPLVKKVYNENVPGMSEGDFWSRFFNSRLVRKLRGEKFTDLDPDPKLDKYLNLDDAADDAPHLLMPSVPHFIDIEGNEQNHSQQLGNRPDMTMRPNTHDKVPILRVLNRMSEKMMADVPPSDGNRHGPVGVDEETYKELQLRDLERAADDNRIVLRVQDQSKFFSSGQGVHTSSSAATYARRTPAQVLATMQQELSNMTAGQAQNAGINLHTAIGVQDDSSSDEEASVKKKGRVGSRSARCAATLQITKAIKKRHLHNSDYMSPQATLSSEKASEKKREQLLQLGLSEDLFDNLTMTHNTTVEFLHYFWAVYYSGDAERASEVAKLIETLDKSVDRLKAVAATAESERSSTIERMQQDIETAFQRTKRRRKFDPNTVKGGAEVVNRLVEPLYRAIAAARDQYRATLSEQMSRQAPVT